MTDAFTTAEIAARIAALKVQLLATDNAITAVLSGQHYSLDTGQSRQTVTRANLTELRNLRAELYTQITEWTALYDGGTDGMQHVIPGF